MKIPDYCKAPLKSRRAIVEYLAKVGGYGSWRDGNTLFTFNVKAHLVDLSFDHLIDVFKESGYYGPKSVYLSNAEFLKNAKALYGTTDWLFDEAIREARCGVTGGDAFKTLYSGEKLDVKLAFMCRSGGYVGITEFEGYDLTRHDRGYWRDVFIGDGDPALKMPYDVLVKLYKYVVMLAHDFTQEAAAREIEHQAAYLFFEGACNDLPKPDAVQLEFAFMR